MKNYLLIISFFLLTSLTQAQENIVTLSSGYSFAKIEDTDVKASGYRINGSYEFNPMSGIIAHGISFGYIHISGSETVASQTITSTVNSFPIYYAPKVMFGSDKFKGFIKGALGLQLAWLKRESIVTLTDNDSGFFGGGGGGFMYFIKDNIFINAEYEIAWASNAFYKDGWMNTAMGGIGFKF